MTEEESTLRKRLLKGERSALARAITYAESGLPEHRALVARLLRPLTDDPTHHASPPRALRVGFSGPPGAGKSTLIERLGALWLERGQRIAVLAIDPSSQRSGGSLLADKTRMPRLSAAPNAFVRPSPAGSRLGGTRDGTGSALRLCELAGYDPVIVETVGTGQSEVDVAQLVDVLVLVLTPDSGDELQGLKRGITEVCDLVVINKADENNNAAERVRAQYSAALQLLRRDGSSIPVLVASAQSGLGTDELWAQVERGRHGHNGKGRQRVGAASLLDLRHGLQRRFSDLLDSEQGRDLLAALVVRLEAGSVSLDEAVEAAWRSLVIVDEP